MTSLERTRTVVRSTLRVDVYSNFKPSSQPRPSSRPLTDHEQYSAARADSQRCKLESMSLRAANRESETGYPMYPSSVSEGFDSRHFGKNIEDESKPDLIVLVLQKSVGARYTR